MLKTFKLKRVKQGRPVSFNRTNILATLGPASENPAMIERIIRAGADGFRLNFSHDTTDTHIRRIKDIRKAAAKLNRPVAIVADQQGPKLRLGDLAEPITVKNGDTIKLAYRPPSQSVVPLQYDLAKKVKPGDRLLINDGKVRTVVMSVKRGVIAAEVQNGGKLSKRKGVNLPDTDLKGDILTPKDMADIKSAVEHDVDYIALSFVQTARDIEHLRRYLKRLKAEDVKIIAKIETRQATENLEDIVLAADALMIARGDLAIETEPESVPVVQREITGLCIKYGKPAIVATQMLGSMTDSTEPTRAEVSDVAVASVTGADCVMLSEETAMGEHPLEAVKMMHRIIGYTEHKSPIKPLYMNVEDSSRQSAISSAVTTLAHQMKAKAIVAETLSGATARSLAAHRPTIPILMVANTQRAANQLTIVYGGLALFRKGNSGAGEKLAVWLKRMGVVQSGDILVIASGKHHGVVGGTDTIKVRAVP